MSFEDSTRVLGAVIWSKWLHFVVTDRNGQRAMLKADGLEMAIKSKLGVKRLTCTECLFMTDILTKREILLSREDISNQNFSSILEVLPPMKKRKKEPKKRR
jgi:hypothetical protein